MSLSPTKVLILVAILCYACSDNKTNGNNAPTLSLLSISKDTMNQGQGQNDSIIVFLKFEDIDGDIVGGFGQPNNIFIVDNRDGAIDPATFPELPDVGDSQKGDMTLLIKTTCCQNPNSVPCEPDPVITFNQYSYDIYISDQAGNESNRVTTNDITLLCN